MRESIFYPSSKNRLRILTGVFRVGIPVSMQLIIYLFKRLLRIKMSSAQAHGWSVIDYLKIDIEGAEGILFEGTYMQEILNLTKVIGIEIHDHMVDRKKIISQLEASGFILHNGSDMTFGYNTNLVNT